MYRTADRGSPFYEAFAATQLSRVLVVEDDAEFRRLIAVTLRRDGFHVVEATNGRELVEHVARAVQAGDPPFDLIVSDIRMPRMTGLEAVAGLRAADWSTPVVLITAFGDAEAEAEATRLGAVLLAKPFDLCDLRTVVMQLAHASI